MARVATLAELHRPPGWVWVVCDRYPPCMHKAPMALAPLVIRWGPDTSGDTCCAGARGARSAATRARRCSIPVGSRMASAGSRSPSVSCYEDRLRALRRHRMGLRSSRRSTVGQRRDVATVHMRRARHALPGVQCERHAAAVPGLPPLRTAQGESPGAEWRQQG